MQGKMMTECPISDANSHVYQYELDSLAGFLKITRSYYANTKDSSFINDNCAKDLQIYLLFFRS